MILVLLDTDVKVTLNNTFKQIHCEMQIFSREVKSIKDRITFENKSKITEMMNYVDGFSNGLDTVGEMIMNWKVGQKKIFRQKQREKGMENMRAAQKNSQP